MTQVAYSPPPTRAKLRHIVPKRERGICRLFSRLFAYFESDRICGREHLLLLGFLVHPSEVLNKQLFVLEHFEKFHHDHEHSERKIADFFVAN